jgi:hypothetical protein
MKNATKVSLSVYTNDFKENYFAICLLSIPARFIDEFIAAWYTFPGESEEISDSKLINKVIVRKSFRDVLEKKTRA